MGRGGYGDPPSSLTIAVACRKFRNEAFHEASLEMVNRGTFGAVGRSFVRIILEEKL